MGRLLAILEVLTEHFAFEVEQDLQRCAIGLGAQWGHPAIDRGRFDANRFAQQSIPQRHHRAHRFHQGCPLINPRTPPRVAAAAWFSSVSSTAMSTPRRHKSSPDCGGSHGGSRGLLSPHA